MKERLFSVIDPGERAARSAVPVLADVARAAGVSIGTASKALNGQGKLRDDTRRRVQGAAQALGFQPNALARGLVHGRTGSIGLLTNDLEGRFSLPILVGAEDALGAGDRSVLLCDARGDAVRERSHLQVLLQRRVDGLIVVGDRADVRPSLGADLPVPVVYAYAPSGDPRDYSIVSDDVHSGRIAARHLLETGRRRIACLGGNPTFTAAHRRADGVAAELAQHGLQLETETLYGPWVEEWGRAGTRLLLERAPGIDGLVCGNDQMARGAVEMLRDLGIEVPRAIAVIGQDNWEPIAAHARPPLTSVDMNLQELGRRAVAMLFEQEEGMPHIQTVAGRVEVRASTV